MQRRLSVYTYALVAALIVFGAVLFIYARRLSIRELGAERLVGDRASLPPGPSATPETLPDVVNLDVPFTSQAPLANWELPFKEACEEASLLMADAYYRGVQLAPQRVADGITRFADFQKARLGYYGDTDAVETALLAREYLHYENVRVVSGPLTVEMIKKEIAAGRPVIVPAAGRLLGNPYYRQPGPYYHMLVIKGYTAAEFITNDPGTRRGKDFRYRYDVLLNAIHDYHPTHITDMPQAMILIFPKGISGDDQMEDAGKSERLSSPEQREGSSASETDDQREDATARSGGADDQREDTDISGGNVR